MPSNSIKGIFFDAGNTLLCVHPSIGEIYATTAREFGADLSPGVIEASFKELWLETAPLVENEGHRLTYERERDWWRHIVREVFKDHIQFEDFEAFFEHLYQRFAQPDCWRLYKEVPKVLKRLKKEGFRMAIISNWDSRLPALVDQLGITPYFESIIVSALVGYEKPHPAIFAIALQQTGLQPHEVVYVGDDPYLDYQAAIKVGMQALHLDRHGRFDTHQHRIASLKDILSHV